MPYNTIMVFIETSTFTKYLYRYLTEEEYVGLQSFLLLKPDAGNIVPGSGGVRKLRWGIAGRGKRGGVRIIYFLKWQDHKIWMLTLYAKNEVSTIPAHILRRMAEEIGND